MEWWIVLFVAAVACGVLRFLGARGKGRRPTPAREPDQERLPSAECRLEPPVSARAPRLPPRPPTPVPSDRPGFVSARPQTAYRFVAFDVETANSDRGSICQVGLALVSAGGSIETLASYVNPKERFTNTPIHGISASDVADAALWPEIFERIAPVLGRYPVIQHSGFDRSAVNAACGAHGLPCPSWQWFDSVQIARRAWPMLIGNGGHGLANLKRHLSIEFEHHHAGEDARAAALVVLRAEAETGRDFADLCRTTTPPRRKAAGSGRPRTRGPLSSSERPGLTT